MGLLQWLFIVTPSRADMLTSGPTPEEAAAVGRHFEYWKGLTAAGQALVVGRTQTTAPDTMGIAIFLAENEERARQIGEMDPAVAAGVFRLWILPYKVALLGDSSSFKPGL